MKKPVCSFSFFASLALALFLPLAGAHVARAASCDLSGTWAVQYSVPLSWRFNAGLEGGSGNYVLQALVTRTAASDGHYTDVLQVCSRAMPTTKTLRLYGSESYGSRFDDGLFDAGVVSQVVTQLHVASPTSDEGAHFEVEPTVLLYGLALHEAQTAAFPRRAADALVAATDPDGDGRPGLRMEARTDAGLSLPPVNPRRSKRAVSFDVVMRDVLVAGGTVNSCDELQGSGQFLPVAGKPGLNATVVGCALQDGSDCVRSDLGIVNGFQPNFQPQPGAVHMRRLAVGEGCAAVRASWP